MSSRATSVAGKVRSCCHLKRVFFYVKGAFRLSCNNLALGIVVKTWIRPVSQERWASKAAIFPNMASMSDSANHVHHVATFQIT